MKPCASSSATKPTAPNSSAPRTTATSPKRFASGPLIIPCPTIITAPSTIQIAPTWRVLKSNFSTVYRPMMP